ncbi:MAG: discoidin domain-containing protein [Opitutales bacterium]|nr:discoidin domain-containing protein [Opitutales bacterium]
MNRPRTLLLALLALLATVFASAQSSNVALNKPATASSVWSETFPPQLAVDGIISNASRWLSGQSATPPHWIELDLGQTYVLDRLWFRTGHSTGTFPFTGFALQTWDGAAWVDLYGETDSTNNGIVDASFAPTVAGNRVRLHITALRDDNTARLYELEIYGVPHALPYTALSPAAGGETFDPAAPVAVTFGGTVSLSDASAIRIIDTGTLAEVADIEASVDGSTLLISHGGLDPRADYRVEIPGGSVVLTSDPAVANGPLSWTFSTAPAEPQLVDYTAQNAELSADIVFTFDRPISLEDPAAITVRRAADNTIHPGVFPAVEGNTLRLIHETLFDEENQPIVDQFLANETYLITINTGAITGVINGVANAPLRRSFFAGNFLLIDADFTHGQDGFLSAQQLGAVTTGTPRPWQRLTAVAGPANDFAYFESQTRTPEAQADFLVSPLVDLVAGETYILRVQIEIARNLFIGLTPTPNMSDIDLIANLSPTGGTTRTITFTANESGAFHLIFHNSTENPWQTQRIGSVSLRRLVAPVINILSPAPGASFLESEPIAVEVEAFGVSGALTNVRLFDGDRSLSTSLPGQDGLFTFDWTLHAPGERLLRADVGDEFGGFAEDAIPVTVTFDNGTLPPYIGWDFFDGAQGWTLINATIQNQSIRVGTNANNNPVSLSSPLVFLTEGEEVTLQFLARKNSTPNYKFGIVLADEPGFPSPEVRAEREFVDFFVSTSEYTLHSFTFTVPADGGYHIVFYAYQPQPINNFVQVNFDDIRIIGSFNTAPLVSLTQPTGNITTIADANVTFSATATDPDGEVVRVEFRDADSGELIAPDAFATDAPWTYTWESIPEGRHRVFARAIDDSAGFSDTAPRTVDAAPNTLSISTYLGSAAADDAFTGAEYLSDGTLVLGAILDPALLPGGVTPLYLDGSAPGDRGLIVRLSEDGRNVLSITVVGPRVFDLSVDDADRIFVAADSRGAFVLNPTADTILWSATYPRRAHRIDAAPDGTFAVLTSPNPDFLDPRLHDARNYLYDASFSLLAEFGGASAFTTDIAVDTASQTVVVIGWKNVANMQDDSPHGSNPVDIPAMRGFAFDGTQKWRAYDWEQQASGTRWLNRIKNNMADTRGARVTIGPDNLLYAAFEFDGGNTPLRDDPFDLGVTAVDRIVGGDQYHTMANTSTVPKTFVGRFQPATGDLLLGQWITNRLPGGNDNTIRIEHGNLRVDEAGRIHVVGGSASGLPLTHDPIPGLPNTGGAYHLVYSPDFRSREFVTRFTFSTSQHLANHHGIAISPSGTIALAGRTGSPFLFRANPWQENLDTPFDALLTVGNLDQYFKFQVADHPRLFFSAEELPAIRQRLDREPFASMLQTLAQYRDRGDFYRFTDPNNGGSLLMRARGSAKLYALTGDETHAADARNDVLAAWEVIGGAWTSTATFGLSLYSWAKDLAIIYDLCAASEAWDAALNFEASRRLLDIATVIVNSGGSSQANDPGSNWQGNRGASAAIALLATDHTFEPALYESAHNRVVNYLNANAGFGPSRGWNPEGFGYTAYPVGSFVGPYGVAAARADASRDLRPAGRLQWKTWTGFAGTIPAINVYGTGGVKTDWANDNAHIGGEGIYGLAFYFAPEDFQGALRHAYDRLMGELSPFGPNWDSVRHGTFWSILFYPDDIAPQDPMENWDWHRAGDDSTGLGKFTFRDGYAGPGDILAQFKTRRYALGQANDGPDGLGIRIIGAGTPFVIGGGRNSAQGRLNQPVVYPSNPNNSLNINSNTGTVVGTPLIKSNGGGHAIGQMGLNNVGTLSHKRWFVTDFDTAATGADATFVVADTSANGLFWQIPTFFNNTVTTDGNTFTITGENGATLRGTILHPTGSLTITTGTKARGDGFTLVNGGTLDTEDPLTNPRIMENRYLFFQGNGDGDFLVVMTLQAGGSPHPTVSHLGGGVANAHIQVGTRTYTLESDNVLYDGVPYVHPPATITFNVGPGGTHTSGDLLQTVPYGEAALEPGITSAEGFLFVGWDRRFDRVVRDMTVNAIFMEFGDDPASFANWIAGFGLPAAEQGLLANPARDGLSNLAKYALGLDPREPNGFDAITAEQDEGVLVVRFRVSNHAPDAVITPLYSPDLDTWQPIPASAIQAVESTPDHTTYEAFVSVNTQPVFVKLEIALE